MLHADRSARNRVRACLQAALCSVQVSGEGLDLVPIPDAHELARMSNRQVEGAQAQIDELPSSSSISPPEKQKQEQSPPLSAKVVAQQPQNAALQLLKWISSFAIPGIGMFMEAYFIFSVGNIKPIWAEQFPQCWKVTSVS